MVSQAQRGPGLYAIIPAGPQVGAQEVDIVRELIMHLRTEHRILRESEATARHLLRKSSFKKL